MASVHSAMQMEPFMVRLLGDVATGLGKIGALLKR
jgi:hypothetical protein